MHDAFDFASQEDILKSIERESKQARVLTLMLQHVCNCSDFIQSYAKDPRFCMSSSTTSLTDVNKQIFREAHIGQSRQPSRQTNWEPSHPSHRPSKGFPRSGRHHYRDNCVPNSG